MAHIAAVLPHLKNAGAMTHDHGNASDGDFAAVLASLTPKTQLPDAKPHAVQPHHLESKQDEPTLEIQKTAPKIVLRIAPPTQKGDAKIPAQLKSHVPGKPELKVLQPSGDVQDEDASLVAPVRPPPQTPARLIDRAAPELDPDTGHPIVKAPPAMDPRDIGSHASLPVPKGAPPVASAQDAPEIASSENVPVLKATPPEHDRPAPAATKVPQAVVDKIVAEAKAPATAIDLSKLVPPKPADKAGGKPDPKVQAVVAKAQASVVVIDKAPPPAPQVMDKDVPQAVDKDTPQPKTDTRIQPRAEQAASEPEAAALQAPPAQSDALAPQAPSAQPAAPAPQQPAANAVVAVVATHAQTASAPQIATAAMQAPAAPEPQIRQPNVAALAAAIAAKSGQGSKMFEIRLDPPELGRVDVHLSVSHDGKAEATLYADRPETVALLRGDSQNLERALKDAGLNVSNSSLNFSLKGEQRQGDGGGASSAHTRNLSHAVVARSEAVNASLANLTYASADGRLDIRV